MTTDTTDVDALRLELLRLRDETTGLRAELKRVEAERDEVRAAAEVNETSAENLRLRTALEDAAARNHTLELRMEEANHERERSLDALRSEYVNSRTWRVGSAITAGLRRLPGGAR